MRQKHNDRVQSGNARDKSPAVEPVEDSLTETPAPQEASPSEAPRAEGIGTPAAQALGGSLGAGEAAPQTGAQSPTDAQETGEGEETLSLRDHLMALRKVIIVCLAAVGVAFVIAFYFIIDPLMGWITAPIEARGIQVIYTAVSEALTTKLKVAAVTAIVLAFPIIIWQVWSFIKPALYPGERRSFRIFFFFALLLFLTGIVFCYASVFFLAIDFFMVSGEGLATPMLSLDKYISFLFGFLLPFGVAFMLPVFIYITTRVGLTTPQMLASKRKYVILGIFVLAAILTPPDVVSQVMLGLPMLALYEVGILVSRLVKKKERA